MLILHPRLNLYHLPPKQRKKQDQEQDPGSQSEGDSEEEPAAKRAPLEVSSVRTKHWPPELTVLDQWYGTLLPHIAPQGWHDARMHFQGSLSPAVHDGLRFNGLTRSETTGTPSIMLGEDFAPVAAPYVNPTDDTRQAYK